MHAKTDAQLRDECLVFYREDVQKIDEVLGEFLEVSGAKCALLIDKEGHMVTRKGNTSTLDLDTVSALVAGSFAATKEMARLLGETEFSVLFHQGKRDHIQLTLVGDTTLLTVIFDDQTTLGMVRLYATDAAKQLEDIFCRRKQSGDSAGETTIHADFSADAQGRLDDVFGS
ncbi:MAG: roadblock/LC7 domain-containing protein [Planctomycetes bacterium]|nr:roadblock/LC7 domain-containing protein [Planctomycetota bacterium]